mmetsp:Transcript_12722/g.11287  ORF Transcript_12722/g.11287 Transcript_12722/m.11287 type:complete len:111 (+) Transcript_12722:224-556(+)
MNIKFSKVALDFFRGKGRDNLRIVHTLRTYVRKMVYCRNKIFKCLKDLQEFNNDEHGNRRDTILMKDDLTQIMENFMPLIKMGYFDKYSIWKIDKRKEDKDYDSEIDLSE